MMIFAQLARLVVVLVDGFGIVVQTHDHVAVAVVLDELALG
jgi:hypothetical protein